MKITVLVDNNTYIDQYYLGEPAVSYYIEEGNNRILFDTGYSDIFISNAEKMGIDLDGLTHIVISHGHNDHTRGLKYLNEKFDISRVSLISHPDCFLPKYFEGEDIGAPYSEEEISKITHYIPSKEVVSITDNLLFLGEIPSSNDFETAVSIGSTIRDNCSEDDLVLDDTAIVYKCAKGIFIITGCSHSGICNIVESAKKVCKEEHILGILGGFHLLEDLTNLDRTIDYLKKNDIEMIYPCHCVSLAAKAKMMSELPVGEVGVGLSITV